MPFWSFRSGNVERLVRVLRIVEVVRDVEFVCVVQIETAFGEKCLVIDLVCDRQPFFLVESRSEEADQREALAIVTAVDQCFVGENRRRRDRARRAD